MLFIHKIIWKRIRLIVVFSLIVSIVAAMVTLFFPLEYRADSQVYIISKSRYGVDPYTVVKSAERVGENIVQVISTEDFFNKVMEQTKYNIDKTKYTNVAERIKRKRWQKTISASVVYGTGMLNVSAYDKKPEQALLVAAAAVDTLAEKGWDYVGGDVILKVVNKPIVTRFPVRPNILVNAILGFILGFLFAGIVVIKKDMQNT